jgi:dihydrofolate reductase
MRSIVAGLFVSLDGVAEAPETWHMSYFDDEMGAAVGGLMKPTLLVGRTTYQGFAEHFGAPENADDPMAQGMTATPKYVVSSTIESPTWANTTVLGPDWVERLRELKTEEGGDDGGDLGVSGSLQLVRGLLEHDLLDELHLLVHPVVVGKGERVFPDGGPQIPLTLLRSAVFGSGVVHLTYARA